MADHSPAPWKVEGEGYEGDAAAYVAVVDADNTLVAACASWGMGDFDRGEPRHATERDWVNARKIAALPLLLRACKAALPKLIEANGGLTHGIEDEIESLREAIAAAEAGD